MYFLFNAITIMFNSWEEDKEKPKEKYFSVLLL